MYYWWCEHCQMEVDSRRVRNDETCDTCGNHVELKETEQEFTVVPSRGAIKKITKKS